MWLNPDLFLMFLLPISHRIGRNQTSLEKRACQPLLKPHGYLFRDLFVLGPCLFIFVICFPILPILNLTVYVFWPQAIWIAKTCRKHSCVYCVQGNDGQTSTLTVCVLRGKRMLLNNTAGTASRSCSEYFQALSLESNARRWSDREMHRPLGF